MKRVRVKVTAAPSAPSQPASDAPPAPAPAAGSKRARSDEPLDSSTQQRRAALAAAYLPPPPPPRPSATTATAMVVARGSTTTVVPRRGERGRLIFADVPEFRPNLTPKEVLQAGAFGGTYFRRIRSGVTGQVYDGDWNEFPADWFEGLPATAYTSQTYSVAVNKYRAKSGQTLEAWEGSGWIQPQDPRGWFQWYCRFYLGRRSLDDARQIARWLGVAGPRGRWMRNLVNQCVRGGKAFDDRSVSPVIRQLLLHWAFDPTIADFEDFARMNASAPADDSDPAAA